MKKAIMTVLASLSETLAYGAVILPNLMFTGLYNHHYGEIDYVMPFVLLYVCEKAGVFIISAIGTVKNPRAIWLSSCILTDAAFLVLIIAGDSLLVWDIGAVMVGFGLSGVPSMYRTTRDALGKPLPWNGSRALSFGYYVFVAYIVALILLRNSALFLVVLIMLPLALVSTILCVLLCKRNPYKGEPVYERGTFRWDQLVYATIVLLFTFVARLYKQIAGPLLIAGVVLGLLALLVAAILLKKKDFRPWSVRTFWYGALRNFVIIFSLIYYISQGEQLTLMVAFMMMVVGSYLTRHIVPVLKKRIPEASYERFCILFAWMASCLLLVPNTICYMAGVLLAAFFTTAGNAASIRLYLADERFPVTERRLVQARFYGLGAVVDQSIMLIALFVISSLVTGSGSEALAGYAFRTGSPDSETVFRWTLLACTIINGLWAWHASRASSRSEPADTQQETCLDELS